MRISALSLVLIGTSLAAAPIDDAKALFEARRIPQAKAAFETLARSGPARAEATFYLGRLELLADRSDQAATFFAKAAELDPKNARYHFWLARAYGQSAQEANPFRAASLAKKALRAFEAAVAADPGYLDARLGLIDFYQIAPAIMGGSEDKAQAQLAAIERIDPAYAHLVRARMLRRAKMTDRIGPEYLAAVRRFPGDPRARLWLAGWHAGEEKWADAIREVQEALRLDPSYMPGHYHLGRIAAASGTSLEAGEASLRRYIAYVPKDDEPTVTAAHYQLGLLYEKLGRTEEAAGQFREAARRAPKYEDAKKALARVSR